MKTKKVNYDKIPLRQLTKGIEKWDDINLFFLYKILTTQNRKAAVKNELEKRGLGEYFSEVYYDNNIKEFKNIVNVPVYTIELLKKNISLMDLYTLKGILNNLTDKEKIKIIENEIERIKEYYDLAKKMDIETLCIYNSGFKIKNSSDQALKIALEFEIERRGLNKELFKGF